MRWLGQESSFTAVFPAVQMTQPGHWLKEYWHIIPMYTAATMTMEKDIPVGNTTAGKTSMGVRGIRVERVISEGADSWVLMCPGICTYSNLLPFPYNLWSHVDGKDSGREYLRDLPFPSARIRPSFVSSERSTLVRDRLRLISCAISAVLPLPAEARKAMMNSLFTSVLLACPFPPVFLRKQALKLSGRGHTVPQRLVPSSLGKPRWKRYPAHHFRHVLRYLSY